MELNEVKRVINQLPTRERPRPEDVMTLPVGHFYAASERWCKLVYVQPAWLSDEEARAVATGEIAVPSPPETEPEEDPMVIADLEEKLQAAESRVQDLDAETARLQGEVARLETELETERRVMEETDHKMAALRTALLDILEDHTGAVALPPAADTNEVVERVLARIGTQGQVIQVTPPEALKHRFQQEALERITAEVKALEPRQRKVVAWLEQHGDTAATSEIALHVEGYEWRRGGRYTVDFGSMLKKLAAAGLMRSIPGARYQPALKARVVERVQPYDQTGELADQVYQHLLYLLTKEGDHGEQG